MLPHLLQGVILAQEIHFCEPKLLPRKRITSVRNPVLFIRLIPQTTLATQTI